MFFWHDPKEPKVLAPDRLALLLGKNTEKRRRLRHISGADYKVFY